MHLLNSIVVYPLMPWFQHMVRCEANTWLKNKIIYLSVDSDMTLEQKPIIHSEYDVFKKKDKGVSEFYDYDVALLKLNSDVQMSKYTR